MDFYFVPIPQDICNHLQAGTPHSQQSRNDCKVRFKPRRPEGRCMQRWFKSPFFHPYLRLLHIGGRKEVTIKRSLRHKENPQKLNNADNTTDTPTKLTLQRTKPPCRMTRPYRVKKRTKKVKKVRPAPSRRVVRPETAHPAFACFLGRYLSHRTQLRAKSR